MNTNREKFAAFFNYIQLLDNQDKGRLSELRKMLEREVEIFTGDSFPIFQDRDDISWGQEWEKRIGTTIDECTYLIAIISPGYFKSVACRKEFELFLTREKSLGRSELILPIVYVETPELKEKVDAMAITVSERQYINWSDLRHEPLESPTVRKSISALALQIRDSIKRNSFHHSGSIPKLVKDVVKEINENKFISLPVSSDGLRLEASLDEHSKYSNLEISTSAYSLTADESNHEQTSDILAPIAPPILLDEFDDNNLPPHLITLFLHPSGDSERDRRRIKNVYGVLISAHGKDRFQFQVFENGRGHLIDFPNDTTHIVPDMLNRLRKLMGEEAWRIEEITYQ